MILVSCDSVGSLLRDRIFSDAPVALFTAHRFARDQSLNITAVKRRFSILLSAAAERRQGRFA